MSPRVTSDLLLVGSIPAASTEDALRAAAVNFAGPGLVFALPDGETAPLDGEPGLRRRQATAAKFLPDFGVAPYCGFRVQPGSTPEQAIREHRDVVTAVRRP
jgi:hypothetical protein